MNIPLIPKALADTHITVTPTEFPVANLAGRNGLTPESVIGNIVNTLSITIFTVAGAAFLLGALMYTAGFINEENKSKGKSLMIGALIGMAVVLAARAIFNTVYAFVYG